MSFKRIPSMGQGDIYMSIFGLFLIRSTICARTQATTTTVCPIEGMRWKTKPPSRGRVLRAVVDALLADPARERYGYELAREIDSAPRTVGVALGRLWTAGWLAERVDLDGGRPGRPRRLYSLTEGGVEAARVWRAGWEAR